MAFKVKKKPLERYFKFTQTEGKWTIALRDDHEQIAPGPPATKYRRVEVDVPMTVPDATETQTVDLPVGNDIWRRVERLTSHATTWIFGSRWRTEGGRFVVMHLFLIVRGLKDCRALVTRSWKGHGVLSCQSTKNVVAIALPFASQEREPVSYCFRKVLEKTL